MEIVLNKRNVTLIIIAVLLLTLIGFTFAYFVGGVGTPAITDTSITGEKESRLQFTPGTPINIVSSLDNFSDGAGSLTGETMSSATLTSSSTEAVVSDEYFVYYYISDNNYVYTKDTSTPELILEVFDNEGNEITTLDGLTYVTTTDALTGDTINGFDVTTYTGLIPIKENMPISATHPDNTTHEWNIKLTFINLDSDQTLNEGKEFRGDLMLRGEKIGLLNESTLANNGGTEAIEAKTTPDFSQIATTNEGMFSAPDDYGTSYYFRGAVDDNWVFFAGFYWRIMRINGDGSIRMIYSGAIQPDESQSFVMTGDGTHIGLFRFTATGSGFESAGYMFTSGVSDGFNISSNIKVVLDNFYSSHLIIYGNNIADSIYCNDRTAYENNGTILSDGVGTSVKISGANKRNYFNNANNPSLVCPEQDDSFTVDDEINGNGMLVYPISTITLDEVLMAGSTNQYYTRNSSFYLYNSNNYWINSSYGIRSGQLSPDVFYFTDSGAYFYQPGYSSAGIRPVISLKSDTIVSGSGTWNNPYTV